MTIDKDSFETLAIVFAVAAIVIWASFKFIRKGWIKGIILAFTVVFCCWQLFFFRVPERQSVGSDTVVCSVADGKVVIVDEYFENEFLKRPCKRVCVYMNFFDVHANFWPVTGEVVYYQDHPGKHLLAFKPKASEDNEHFSTCVRTADGNEVFFRQIAGTFARRIRNYSEMGMKTVAGEQCGIILFGSRIDMYLPLTAEVKVKEGELVRACESVIATLEPAPAE